MRAVFLLALAALTSCATSVAPKAAATSAERPPIPFLACITDTRDPAIYLTGTVVAELEDGALCVAFDDGREDVCIEANDLHRRVQPCEVAALTPPIGGSLCTRLSR